MWARDWSTLSGGEGQRIALAIAVGLGGAEVVLLDGESPPPPLGSRRPSISPGLVRNHATLSV
jgi:ABC-type molybdate transport system ATPase subunit